MMTEPHLRPPPQFSPRGLFAVMMIIAAVLLLYAILPAGAQMEDHHHPGMNAAVDHFYSTWNMPDEPMKSCCNKLDCYPTEVMSSAGVIYARRREDGKWLRIPEAKIERNRDNPDGRNHLCAPPPNTDGGGRGDVFCFALGGGT